MNYKVGDVIIVVSVDAFYCGAIGRIREVYEDYYNVVFEAKDMDTGEVFIYEECDYLEEEIELFDEEKMNIEMEE